MSGSSLEQSWRFRTLLIHAIVLVFLALSIQAKTIQVDKDGGTGVYTTIGAALLESVASSGDTIKILGGDIDTYTTERLVWNIEGHHQSNVTITGSTSNPDSFPVVTINWQSTWWNVNPGTTVLKNLKLTGCSSIQLAAITGRKLRAENCIFERTSSPTFRFVSNPIYDDSLLIVNNCIFTNITGQIYSDIPTLSNSPAGPYGIFNNCTFYSVQDLSNDNLQYPATDSVGKKFVLITNSIFNSVPTMPNSSITRYYTNCLVPASLPLTDWGIGCVFSDTPLFSGPTTKGSGFQLQSGSPAINKAGTNATTTDFVGKYRFSTPDIGVYEFIASPNNIQLSNSSITENLAANSIVGTITVVDANDPGPHSLVLSGTDSSSFTISNGQLIAVNSLNYEAKSSYSISIRATDQHTLSFTKAFTITVTNASDPPTGLTLTNTTIVESNPVGMAVCTLKTVDEDGAAVSHTYSLVTGGADNASFSITSNILNIQTITDYETKRNYFIRLQTSDGVASYQKTCTLYVSNENDPLTDVALSNATVLEQKPVGTFIGKFSVTDPDVPPTQTSYTLVMGNGGTDNASFQIRSDSLLSGAIFNYTTKSSFSIRIKATDVNNNAVEKAFIITIGAPPVIVIQPVSKTVGVNKSTSFTLTASGPGTLTYSWYRTDIAPVQGTASELIIPNIPIELDKKVFYCTVSNIYDSVKSSLCTLTVIPLPKINSLLRDTSVLEGSSVFFTINASGLNLSYTWLKNGDTLSSKTTSQSIINVTHADSGDTVWCIVSNEAGSVRSSGALIHVLRKPVILTEPKNDTVSDGDSANFSLIATGATPLSYQWYKNAQPITGAMSAFLKIPKVTMADSNSTFFCIVTNIFDKDTSASVKLIVFRSKPVIDIQPRTITVPENDSGFMYVKAHGTPVLTYNWYRSGSLAPLSATDTLWIKKPNKAADSGSTYYCVIANSQGNINSDTVKLLVGNVAPGFDRNLPLQKTVYVGDTTRIIVTAIGSKPLTFTWRKVGSTTPVRISDTLLIPVTTKSDSGYYYCIVSNSAGNSNSDTMHLIVTDRPRAPFITRQPNKQEIVKGDSAIFSISADGNPPPKYQWMRNNIIIAGATESILILKGINDSLSKIYCIVSNSIDTITSDTTTLKILLKPKANFSANTTTGPDSSTVFFMDSSKGPVKSWLWRFGDSTTSTLKNPSHIYAKPGLYTVSLKVSTDSIGSDSMTIVNYVSIYQRGGNPVRITGQYLSGRNIKLSFTNLDAVDTTPPVPLADSLGLWFKSNGIPLSNAEQILLTYNKTIFSSMAGKFDDTVTIPSTDSLIGLMTGIFYNDRLISRFDAANGTTILLSDTLSPPNPLTVQATYSGGDSTRFVVFIPSNHGLDTARLDSIYISFATDSAQLSITGVNKFGISVSEFFKLQKLNLFTVSMHSELFTAADAKIYYTLTIKAKNTKTRRTNISSFLTSSGNNTNPIVLQCTALRPSVVELFWKKFVDPTVIAIRIFSSTIEIPIGMIYPTFPMDTLNPLLSDTVFRANNLNSSTTYWFAAQVKKKVGSDYIWSPVAVESRCFIKTPNPLPTDTITNTIDITELRFDSLSASLKVGWKLVNNNHDSLNVAITYSTERYPELLPSQPQTILTTNTSENDISILLNKSIQFETTYYITLWLRKLDGPWAPPTDSSKGMVTTLSFGRQPVTFFNEGVDTVYVNNGKILLWKDNSYPANAIPANNVAAAIDERSFAGMIPVGKGFKFTTPMNLLDIYVGIQYTLPPKFKDSDVKLYRIDANGLLSIEYKCDHNELSKMVFTKTKDLSLSFVPLIDTQPPVLTISSDTSSPKNTNIMFFDTISVTDNIKNIRVTHTANRGEDLSATSIETTTGKAGETIILPVSLSAISNIAGARLSVKVDDGRSSFVANTSRRVIRSSSDEGVTEELRWHPIFTTANLKSTKPDSLFKIFSKVDSAKYDNRHMRLYRWYQTKNNQATPQDRWVEYSDSNSELFSLTPGKLMWLKTKSAKAFDLGYGTTVSLKDSFSITLQPQDWTDIALPFKFSSSIQKITASNPSAGQLQYYQWNKNKSRYETSLLYSSGLPVKGKILNKENVFSVYNPTSAAITIKIPPYPANPIEETALLPKSQTQQPKNEWWVKVNTRLNDNSSIADIYCGYSPQSPIAWFPVAPSFSTAKIHLFNREENKVYGHYVESNKSNGIAKELLFTNESDTLQTFHFGTENIGAFPENYSSSVLNIATQQWETSGSVTVAPHSREYRWLVAGDDLFRGSFLTTSASFKYKLHSLYPNPARSIVNIRYSVPFSVQEKLTFTIYDALGRKIWFTSISEPLTAGIHSMTWNGRNQQKEIAQAGMYVVVLNVLNEKGSIIHRFKTRLTYIP